VTKQASDNPSVIAICLMVRKHRFIVKAKLKVYRTA
jgi:hypothetical protein